MTSIQVLTIALLSLLVSRSESAYFCDMKAIDNVWNVGHMIHMSRCGHMWVYDPRMDGGAGGFIRDYSWYGKGRQLFSENVIKQLTEYKPEHLHFAAFSFQEVNCDRYIENINKDCAGSVRNWNGLSVMADNHSVYTFKYESDFWEPAAESFPNPLGFKYKQELTPKAEDKRDKFWPDIHKLAKDERQTINLGEGHAFIRSGLFIAKDSLLLIVLLSPNSLYYCVTYLDMWEILHDSRKWPEYQRDDWTPEWSPCNPFTGHVVGMFYDEVNGKSYIVGRVSYENRYYEDQIYTMEARNGLPITFEAVIIDDKRFEKQTLKEHPINLRTYFGCDRREVFNTAPIPPVRSGRKKRSDKDLKEKSSAFKWEDIKQELRDDWKSLSSKSLIVLFLTFILVRLSNQIIIYLS